MRRVWRFMVLPRVPMGAASVRQDARANGGIRNTAPRIPCREGGGQPLSGLGSGRSGGGGARAAGGGGNQVRPVQALVTATRNAGDLNGIPRGRESGARSVTSGHGAVRTLIPPAGPRLPATGNPCRYYRGPSCVRGYRANRRVRHGGLPGDKSHPSSSLHLPCRGGDRLSPGVGCACEAPVSSLTPARTVRAERASL